jgi:hypothetical protein
MSAGKMQKPNLEDLAAKLQPFEDRVRFDLVSAVLQEIARRVTYSIHGEPNGGAAGRVVGSTADNIDLSARFDSRSLLLKFRRGGHS